MEIGKFGALNKVRKFIGKNNFKIFSGNTLQILWQETTLYSFNQWEERDESF